MTIIITAFVLMLLFQVKHFLADYIFQNEYHLGKFKETGWVIPLTCHCLWHVGFTLVIVGFFLRNFDAFTIFTCASIMAAFDFCIHFIMDRVKASPSVLGKYKPDQKEFWWSLGLDQMVHHVTDSITIAVILVVMFYA